MINKPEPVIYPWTKTIPPEFEEYPYIILRDHMPVLYDYKISFEDKKEYTKNSYKTLFENSNIDYGEKVFFATHYLKFQDFEKVVPFDLKMGLNFFNLPFRWYRDTANVLLNNCMAFRLYFGRKDSVPDILPTKNLCFSSPKPTPARHLTARCIANFFSAENIAYRYARKQFNTIGKVSRYATEHLLDRFEISDQITTELLIDIDYNISKSTLKDNLDMYDVDLSPRYTNDNIKGYYPLTFYHKNPLIFEKLFPILFSTACTSIIPEPSFYELGTGITEKTLNAIYSGHFLLWAGNYGAADVMENLGFDTFSDVIDHSYQWEIHPGKRIVECFSKNIDFLSNLEMQSDLRQTFIDRLNQNLYLAQDYGILYKKFETLQVGSKKIDNVAELDRLHSWVIKNF